MSSPSDPQPPSSVGVIGIPNLDRPLYRIFPLWFFEHALRVNGGCLVLVPPTAWEDPYEDLCARIVMAAPDRSQKELSGYLRPTYAQCWSFEGESDALLRAYSRVTRDHITQRNVEPKYEGVQVRTTPRKLVSALNAFLNKRKDPSLKFYLGIVEYVSDFPQVIINRLNLEGPVAIGEGEDRVRSLLFKREAFRHEAEVRIILLAPRDAKWEHFVVDINPNEVFEEVRFDPRLALFERKEREKLARDLGYMGPFADSGLYQNTIFLTPLAKHWDEY
jgi:hypothetical protein